MKRANNNLPPVLPPRSPYYLSVAVPPSAMPSPTGDNPNEGKEQDLGLQANDFKIIQQHLGDVLVRNPDYAEDHKFKVKDLTTEIATILNELQANLASQQSKSRQVPNTISTWYLHEVYCRYVNLLADIQAKPRSVLLYFSSKPKPALAESAELAHVAGSVADAAKQVATCHGLAALQL